MKIKYRNPFQSFNKCLSSISLFFLLFFNHGVSQAQITDYDIGPVKQYTIQFKSNGFPADIYYPSGHSQKRFPVVVFVQAANVSKDSYSLFASQVASSGFIVIIPNTEFSLINLESQGSQYLTNESPFPFESYLEEFHSELLNDSPIHGSFLKVGTYPEAAVVPDAFNEVISESEREQSPIHGKADPDKLALIGHSFGGVVGLHVLDGSKNRFPFCRRQFNTPAALKAAVLISTKKNLGPVNLSFNTRSIPVAFITGDRDGKASLNDVYQTYESVEKPKAFFTLEGANHFCISNEKNPPGKLPDPGESIIDQQTSISRAARWTAEFLKVFVNGDAAAQRDLTSKQDQTVDGVQIHLDFMDTLESHPLWD